MRDPTPLSLSTPFGIDGDEPALVAFTGGGGKTSLMFALARTLAANGRTVIVTTTTRLMANQTALAPAVVTWQGEASLAQAAAQARAHGVCLVVGPVSGQKVLGVAVDVPAQLLALPGVDVVLVEADGARMRPIKAPAAHEPVIPPQATLLVPVLGIDALAQPLADAAHRPERVQQLLSTRWPVPLSQPLTPAQAAFLLTHPQGGLKGAPSSARIIPFINKVETAVHYAAARTIAHAALAESKIESVFIGAVQQEQPLQAVARRVTAVVLAAGESRRMGDRTKQLLPWGETTVLGQTIRHVKETAVHDVVVVTGHRANEIEAVARQEGAATIFNPDYAAGEMLSSLQTAVRALPESVTAVLVVLADQPTVLPQTMDPILDAYWQGRGELVAPMVNGRRGNPVLIGRRYFEELLALPAGEAPRTLLRRHEDDLHLLPVTDPGILQDLDDPAAYAAAHAQWQEG